MHGPFLLFVAVTNAIVVGVVLVVVVILGLPFVRLRWLRSVRLVIFVVVLFHALLFASIHCFGFQFWLPGFESVPFLLFVSNDFHATFEWLFSIQILSFLISA